MKYVKNAKNKLIKVSNKDFDLVSRYSWYVDKNRNKFYARSKLKDRTIKMHRLIMNAKPGEIIDHINGNGLDNRRCNLRIVTNSQNQMNRTKTIKNKSGYKGVYLDQKTNKYMAQLRFKGKLIYLGLFKTKKQAAIAYNQGAKRYFGKFAKFNTIKGNF